MIQGRDIVCISSIDWDFNWQGPQELTSRLASAGNRVCFIENTGIRAPRLKDAKRIGHRFGSWARALSSHGLRLVQPNLYVHSPLVLPPFGPTWERRFNSKILLRQARRAVRSIGMKDVLIVCYLPTDTTFDLIEILRTPKSVVVYYRVDNLALLIPHPELLQKSEAMLIEASDLVFANSKTLAELPSRTHSDVHVFPPSINLEAFPAVAAPSVVSNGPATSSNNGSHKNGNNHPRHQRAKGPVIGYVGAWTEHVDQPLLTEMARLRPDWHWRFVGPCQTALDDLRQLPNVQFLGQQPHRQLVNYIRDFDVCIIPYKMSAYTNTVVPTKLNEYLAVGNPVVSTNLPSVNSFNEEHGVLLTSNEEPGSFLKAIEEALLLPNDEALIARRRAVAASGDWQTRIEAMGQLFEQALAAKAGQSNPKQKAEAKRSAAGGTG